MSILERIGKLFGKGKPTLKSLSVDDLKQSRNRKRLCYYFTNRYGTNPVVDGYASVRGFQYAGQRH